MNQANSSQPNDPVDDPTRTASQNEIAELIEITRSEGEAIRQLDGCVAQLCRVQAAKQALLQLDPAELRAALMRHLPTGLRLGEPR